MVIGATMGFFITYLKVQPFIATLAGMWVARGLCFWISDNAIPIHNRVYDVIAQTKILIPGLADPVTKRGEFVTILVVVELVILAIAVFVAQYTRFGRAIYAIGGNEGSARLMGLPVNRTKMMVYTLNGLCSALAGIALSIYVSSGHGLYATGLELTVIAAVVIGGTLLTGGSGYVIGTLFGVLIIGLIQTLIQFNGQLSSWWTPIVVGALTLVFIGVQSFLEAQKSRQSARHRLQIRPMTGEPRQQEQSP
jgi:galactofuranose transport system permease protein